MTLKPRILGHEIRLMRTRCSFRTLSRRWLPGILYISDYFCLPPVRSCEDISALAIRLPCTVVFSLGFQDKSQSGKHITLGPLSSIKCLLITMSISAMGTSCLTVVTGALPAHKHLHTYCICSDPHLFHGKKRVYNGRCNYARGQYLS